jgi:hypothetical protein
MEDKLPNALDLKGQNALGVSNQGENLRDNPLVGVTKDEILASSRRSSRSGFSDEESISSSSMSSRSGDDLTPTPRTMGRIREKLIEKYGTDVQRFATDIETKIGMAQVPAMKEARRGLGKELPSLTVQTGSRGQKVGTMADFVTSSTATKTREPIYEYATSSTATAKTRQSIDPFASLVPEISSGGAGARVASDTDFDMSRYEGYS